MDTEALKRRILLGEDSATEFKLAAKASFRLDADVIAKEIAALANSGGGELIVGVEDDGAVSGLGDSKQADQALALVAQATQQNLHPPLWCMLRKVALDGNVVLVVSVPGFHPQRPFRARHIYYVRDGSISREATREELERILQSPSFHFDDMDFRDPAQTDRTCCASGSRGGGGDGRHGQDEDFWSVPGLGIGYAR